MNLTRIPFCLAVVLLAMLAFNQPALSQDVVAATADDILEQLAASDSEYTLVNIWATWCSPCVEEFPDIVNLASDYDPATLNVVFVSLDFPEEIDQVYTFLKANNWQRKSYIRHGKDNDFVNGFIPEWTGAVPATFIFDSNQALIWIKESMTTKDELSAVMSALVQ